MYLKSRNTQNSNFRHITIDVYDNAYLVLFLDKKITRLRQSCQVLFCTAVKCGNLLREIRKALIHPQTKCWTLRTMKEDGCSQYGVTACCVFYTRLEGTLTQSHFLLICPSSDFLKIQHVSVAGSASIFRQRSTYISGPLRLGCFQSLGTILGASWPVDGSRAGFRNVFFKCWARYNVQIKK
jgi:hypothetical protein